MRTTKKLIFDLELKTTTYKTNGFERELHTSKKLKGLVDLWKKQLDKLEGAFQNLPRKSQNCGTLELFEIDESITDITKTFEEGKKESLKILEANNKIIKVIQAKIDEFNGKFK